jgi:hypothetical protein
MTGARNVVVSGERNSMIGGCNRSGVISGT